MATQDIFARLKQDHDRHRELLARIAEAVGGQARGDQGRLRDLFEEFTLEVKGHAAAEEQALYSTMMRKPETTDDTRHSVAEHHEIEEMLNDLAATDLSSDDWETGFRALQHDYLHHIEEEEEEHFPEFSRYLTEEDEAHMKQVFDRRKKAEKASAEVTPEKMEDAKE